LGITEGSCIDPFTLLLACRFVIFVAILFIASQLGYVVISIAAIVILFVTGRCIITDYSALRCPIAF
jgi:hypothetical protein